MSLLSYFQTCTFFCICICTFPKRGALLCSFLLGAIVLLVWLIHFFAFVNLYVAVLLNRNIILIAEKNLASTTSYYCFDFFFFIELEFFFSVSLLVSRVDLHIWGISWYFFEKVQFLLVSGTKFKKFRTGIVIQIQQFEEVVVRWKELKKVMCIFIICGFDVKKKFHLIFGAFSFCDLYFYLIC